MFLNIIDDISKFDYSKLMDTIPTINIIFSLLTALITSIIINFIYRKTYIGVSYTQSFSLSIILLSMVTSLIIRTINSNLSLSLGMVGALSIVRFRTAVKDPIDTIFMFWAISVGIMSGAGLYLAAILSTLIIGIFYFISYTYQGKSKKKYLLVVKTYSINSNLILDTMNKNSNAVLKTESYKNNIAEFTYELANREEASEILKYKDSNGILNINLLEID